MKIIRDKKKSFDLEEFLTRPLFAHLSTMSEDAPRDSPVWFHWEKERLWIIGNTKYDTFPDRIRKNPKCAIGVVDYDLSKGIVLHAGFRGQATVEDFDEEIAIKLLFRYLGTKRELWDKRFTHFDHNNILINFVPETVVIRDQSFTSVR